MLTPYAPAEGYVKNTIQGLFVLLFFIGVVCCLMVSGQSSLMPSFLFNALLKDEDIASELCEISLRSIP